MSGTDPAQPRRCALRPCEAKATHLVNRTHAFCEPCFSNLFVGAANPIEGKIVWITERL